MSGTAGEVGTAVVQATIDGREVSVPSGTTILEAARDLGIDIPTLCHHETLAPSGACRLCVVEVEGRQNLVASCGTALTEGMVLYTESEAVVESRRLILDLQNPEIHFLAREFTGQETIQESATELPDGRRVRRGIRTGPVDLHRQTLHVEQIFYVTTPDGRQERLVHAYDLRYIYRYEAEHLLARCGFELTHVYAGFDRQPYGSEYPGELILVARKASDTTIATPY